jgi:hypothetical protein
VQPRTTYVAPRRVVSQPTYVRHRTVTSPTYGRTHYHGRHACTGYH